jgi:hypothetical protein
MTPDFSIPQFLAWARSKPADEEYEFCLADECALGQFLQAKCGFSAMDCYRNDPFARLDISIRQALGTSDSFGALVTRLEKLCPSEWVSVEAYLVEIEQVEA